MTNLKLKKALPFYEQIYQSIKQLIYDGVYKPGDRIYEAKIAKEFDVSRSPVREAVRALMKEGLLTMDEKSQISIYKPSLKDVEDIYQCRSSLESLAVSLTTVRATNEELNQLEMLLADTETHVTQDQNKDKIVLLNQKFHECIIHYCDNYRLQKHLNDLRSLTYYYRVLNIQGKNRISIIFNEHYSIFDKIKQRNEQKASALMREHTLNDLNNLQRIFRNGQ